MVLKICMTAWLLIVLNAALTGQVVKIPDPNFKNALIQNKVDINGDGEIQVSEAKKVTKLYLEALPFTSLEGIKSFTNLVEFGTFQNKIKQVDLEGMTSLTSLYLLDGDIESVNLKGCVNLELLGFTKNHLTTIDLSALKKLKDLDLSYNRFTKLEINDHPGLKKVLIDDNNMSEFRISRCPRLQWLDISTNNIATALDLTVFPDLVFFDASKNHLPSVEIRGLDKLKAFYCLYCNLTNLNLAGAKSLEDLMW
ncbi:leucine-rich repeat domain-containing protein [Niabella beijingensis]|uniref:leucine-rich repeat domain-containing protein n=1 Tax=Niabella beijingensis TaxID=2872700 RepID=UPI001CBDC4A2|nr:hypothetical protein [Niabella beijingensis]MBZ4191828.1 hypothetical protein [Niabella beijingensis]